MKAAGRKRIPKKSPWRVCDRAQLKRLVMDLDKIHKKARGILLRGQNLSRGYLSMIPVAYKELAKQMERIAHEEHQLNLPLHMRVEWHESM